MLKNAAFKLADAEFMFEYPSLPVAVLSGWRADEFVAAGDAGGDGESNDITESIHISCARTLWLFFYNIFTFI